MVSFHISISLLCYIFFYLLSLNSEASVNFVFNFCSPNSDIYILNSTYHQNLRFVLSSLQSNSSERGFYNLDSRQEPPDNIYGLFSCRGDVTQDICQECVSTAAVQIVQRCPNRKTAFIYYDECTLRYSNQSFFSVWKREFVAYLFNTTDVSKPNEFMGLLENTMKEITMRAASEKMFATEEVSFTNFETLYTLAQCTQDLVSSCDSCLRSAIASLPSCCRGKQGARVILPSCNIRYELYRFYRITAEPPPQTAVPPSPQAPQTKEEKKQKKSLWIPLLASLSASLGLALFSACGFFIWRTRNIHEDRETSQEVQLLELVEGRICNGHTSKNSTEEKGATSQKLPSFQLHILRAATNHFSDENKLGKGGFGPVYKGTLADGKEIAVKRLSRTSHQGLREFKNEVMLIARLQHRNLVRLLGCCLEKNETLLVYEFMPNRSLDVFLFDPSMVAQLSWQKRFSIIKGIARGILYLHEDSRLKVIHRDLKASNVLLDHEMNPKISDFGMARIFGGDQNQANTNRVVGTYGYMAPEYAMEGLFSIKSDVFSFGVLLLEIITGKKNNGFHLTEHGQSLLTFAWKLWSEGQGMKLLDQNLVESCVVAEVLKCIHIGLLCVQEDPADRPSMTSVIVILESETVRLPRPATPAFSVGRVVAKPTQPTSTDRISSVYEMTISDMSPR